MIMENEYVLNGAADMYKSLIDFCCIVASAFYNETIKHNKKTDDVFFLHELTASTMIVFYKMPSISHPSDNYTNLACHTCSQSNYNFFHAQLVSIIVVLIMKSLESVWNPFGCDQSTMTTQSEHRWEIIFFALFDFLWLKWINQWCIYTSNMIAVN